MSNSPKNLLKSLDTTSVLLSEAENGNIDSAQQLLQKAAELIRHGTPLPKELAAWISDGLQALAQEQNWKSAFKLSVRRGRPAKHSEEFERLVATSIHFSKFGRHKGSNSEDSSQGAYTEASTFFDIAENTAAQYYNKHIESIRMEDQIRREFAEEHETD